MQINEVHLRQRVEVINTLLESRYGLRIEPTSAEHLTEVRAHYMDKRAVMLARLGEARALKHPDYAKAVLIAEAVGMILREIAPKRRKRKSSGKA